MCVLIPQEEIRVVRKHNWKKRQEIMYNRLRADISDFFPPGRYVMYGKQIVTELTLLSRGHVHNILGSVAHLEFGEKTAILRENIPNRSFLVSD